MAFGKQALEFLSQIGQAYRNYIYLHNLRASFSIRIIWSICCWMNPPKSYT